MTDQRPEHGSPPEVVEREPTGPQGVVEDVEAQDEPGDAAAAEDTSPSAPAVADTPAGDDSAAETSEDQPDWAALAEVDPRSRAELLAELTEAESRRDEYLDDLRRARAEFENYRKRMLREAQQMRSAGTADLASRLLDVLDDFDRTLQAADTSEDEGLAKGVQLVHSKLTDVLTNAGLTRIDEAGVPFDPERHEAVQQVPADEPADEPVVAQVLRPGYEIGGRVVRAAMVTVEQ
jgi:molecular chaperone GrpE